MSISVLCLRGPVILRGCAGFGILQQWMSILWFSMLCLTHNMYTKSSNTLHRNSEDCKRNSIVIVRRVKKIHQGHMLLGWRCAIWWVGTIVLEEMEASLSYWTSRTTTLHGSTVSYKTTTSSCSSLPQCEPANFKKIPFDIIVCNKISRQYFSEGEMPCPVFRAANIIKLSPIVTEHAIWFWSWFIRITFLEAFILLSPYE